MNKKFEGLPSRTVMWLMCVVLLMSACASLPRDRSVVKKETAEAAAALGLTSADLLLAVDSSIDIGRYVYREYYITATATITYVETLLNPLGYGTAGPSSSGKTALTELNRISSRRLSSIGPNSQTRVEIGNGVYWLKSRGQGSWTSVDTYVLSNQPELYKYDGKPLSGTLVILLATYN
jgi:hypothetical protein